MDGAANRRIRLSGVAALALVASLSVAVVRADEPPHIKMKFNLPSDEFPKAILEFYRQSRIEVLFLSKDELNAIHTHPVTGEYEPAEALDIMLEGTGLIYNFATDHSVSIKQVLTQNSAEQPASTSVPQRASSLLRRMEEAAKRLLRPPPGSTDVVIAADRSQTWRTSGEPALSLSQEEIAETGALSMPDVLTVVPQVWGGGPNEYSSIGLEAATNATRGYGMNPRGVDAGGAVLTFDGLPVARAGTAALYVDVSMFPLAPISRVDMVLDGGSTRYGSDAVTGVVNFKTADFVGAETRASAGQAIGGAPGERQFAQQFGTDWGSGRAWIAMEYYDRGALPASDRGQATSDLTPWGGANFGTPYGYPGNLIVGGQTWAITGIANGKPVLGAAGTQNLYNWWTDFDILPWQQRFSTVARASQTVGPADVWSEMLISSRHATSLDFEGALAPIVLPATNPGYVNPTGGSAPVMVETNTANLLGPVTSDDNVQLGLAALGVATSVSKWHTNTYVSVSWDRESALEGNEVNYASLVSAIDSTVSTEVLNPFASKSSVAPGLLKSLRLTNAYKSHSNLLTLHADGSRDILTIAGSPVTATFGAEFREETQQFEFSGGAEQDFRRDLAAGFGVLELPVISPDSSVPLIQRLQLTVGERYERYSRLEGDLSPKADLTWQVTRELKLRGTYARSFRPAALADEYEGSNQSQIVELATGQRALAVYGGNAGLQPEHATTYTFGADYVIDSGPEFGITGFHIGSTGRIDQPTVTPSLQQFIGNVIQNPSSSRLAQFCTDSHFNGGTVATCEQSDPAVIVDSRLQNLQTLTTSGVDLSTVYRGQSWKLRFDATKLFTYVETTAHLGTQSLLNTINYPVDFRARISATKWFRHLFGTLSLDFTDSYRDPDVSPTARIGSWSRFSGQLGYKLNGDGTGDSAIVLGAQNMLDRRPPSAPDSEFRAAWDPENGGNLLGLVMTLQVRYSW